MHELGIAASVLDAVQAEAQKYPGMRMSRVGLRIGELAAVDPEALRFAFEALTRETEFESMALEIEMCPRRHRCGDCATVFEARDFVFACPRCGASHTECISGEELEIAYLEVDDEPRAARTQSA
ncbi:MAG TPA: hydrogenase maturation nickel metallochaperone HypA [Candidatus Polarisedimenticolia bacterium]|jgi:hydrogenase nickel incorporation protein HypA/HybF|nr:hydrogenase maturation nickel metallochaperone HypA [Candidatus Polarisedimenticolia bacterium]